MDDQSRDEVAPGMPRLSPEEMADYRDQMITLVCLTVIEMLSGRKFDKKEMSNDLNKLTQVFAWNYAASCEKRASEES